MSDALAAGEGLNLTAIRARADAATPGPWHIVERFGISAPGYQGYEPNSWACLANVDDGESCRGDQDADFIAAARTDVPALCDEVTALRAKLAQSEARVRELEERIEDACALFNGTNGDAVFARLREEVP